MDRAGSTSIVVAVILLALAGMLIGWRGRQRRQSFLPRPHAVPTEVGAELLRVDALYVATTMADSELDRVSVSGLGYRARATVVVAEGGVILSLAGGTEAFLPRASLLSVDRATFAIDRVVERGGLVRLTWLLGETPLDSYLRLTNAEDVGAMIDAVHPMLPTTISLEGDAE